MQGVYHSEDVEVIFQQLQLLSCPVRKVRQTVSQNGALHLKGLCEMGEGERGEEERGEAAGEGGGRRRGGRPQEREEAAGEGGGGE